MNFLPRKHNSCEIRNPLWEMDKLHRDMARVFDLAFPGTVDNDVSLWAGAWSPAVDVLDRKNAIVVKADLPGLSREDIDVSIENNVLMIKGEKKSGADHKEGDVVRSERYYGSFHRAFTLPASVSPDKVEARFKDGVLELVIAKKEEAKPRQIKVEVR